eukprot:2292766-Pleurochrysis_carterae.AAC.1
MHSRTNLQKACCRQRRPAANVARRAIDADVQWCDSEMFCDVRRASSWSETSTQDTQIWE